MQLGSFFAKCVTLALPWTIRRLVLQRFFGYQIHPTARIKCSWFFPRHLEMLAHSSIGPFCVAIHLDRVRLGRHSTIGRRNWITGFPSGTGSLHFQHQAERKSELIIGEHSAITKNHHLDCTSPIHIGDFVTIAGYYSQFLTHSIDLEHCRQASAPIRIGDYAFVGTNVTVLGGATLPAKSVLGACALLNKPFDKNHTLYAGVPAKPIATLPDSYLYFQRHTGFVE